MNGPLAGITVVELGGVGPIPFAGMMLADFGADVIRIDRPGSGGGPGRAAHHAVLDRGRRAVTVDLGDPAGVRTVLDLCVDADVLIEGFRPGVTERLGLGPTVVHAINPRLVYGRGTGWGQDGPYAGRAGHDIDYLAVSGALEPIVGSTAPRPHRSTSSVTSAAVACCSPTACSLRCCTPGRPARARWSTRRSSTGSPCSPPCTRR